MVLLMICVHVSTTCVMSQFAVGCCAALAQGRFEAEAVTAVEAQDLGKMNKNSVSFLPSPIPADLLYPLCGNLYSDEPRNSEPEFRDAPHMRYTYEILYCAHTEMNYSCAKHIVLYVKRNAKKLFDEPTPFRATRGHVCLCFLLEKTTGCSAEARA